MFGNRNDVLPSFESLFSEICTFAFTCVGEWSRTEYGKVLIFRGLYICESREKLNFAKFVRLFSYEWVSGHARNTVHTGNNRGNWI